MSRLVRAAAAALVGSLLVAAPAAAQQDSQSTQTQNTKTQNTKTQDTRTQSTTDQAGSTVKVALLDMTALFGPGSGPGAGPGGPGGPGWGPGRGWGPGMMGQGYGPGYGRGWGMMGGYGPGYGMMGPGMMGPGGPGHMMGMMSVRTDTGSVKAGKITFDVSNLSRSLVHEMIVVAVDDTDTPLPYDYNTGQIPEQQIKMLGETEEMQPNATKTLTLDLKPGKYLLICNVPGHYAAGMWTALTVTP